MVLKFPSNISGGGRRHGHMTHEGGWHTRSCKRSWKPSRPLGARSTREPLAARPEGVLLPPWLRQRLPARRPAPPRRRHRRERQHRLRQRCIAARRTRRDLPGEGYTLRCYHCDNSPTLCRTNSTCLTTEDTCLQLKFGKLRTFSCWKSSQCSVNEIADSFLLDNFEFFCCQHDLCNESAITGVNKAAFSIASLMAMLWMLL